MRWRERGEGPSENGENGVRVGFLDPRPARATARAPTIHRPPPPTPPIELPPAPATRETGATALTILPPESLVAALTPLPPSGGREPLGRRRRPPPPPFSRPPPRHPHLHPAPPAPTIKPPPRPGH